MDIVYNNRTYRCKEPYYINELVSWSDGYDLIHYAVGLNLEFHKYKCVGNDSQVLAEYESVEEEKICLEVYSEWLKINLEKSLCVQDKLLLNTSYSKDTLTNIVKFREYFARNKGFRSYEYIFDQE